MKSLGLKSRKSLRKSEFEEADCDVEDPIGQSKQFDLSTLLVQAKPKRPLPGYTRFVKERIATITKQEGIEKHRHAMVLHMKAASNEWKSLDSEQKEKYERLGDKDRALYHVQI